MSIVVIDALAFAGKVSVIAGESNHMPAWKELEANDNYFKKYAP